MVKPSNQFNTKILKYDIYRLKTIIIPFSDNFVDDDIEVYIKRNNPLDDSKITISKRVKSLRQLTRVGKELVKLSYKEAVLKCFSLEDICKFISLKTKILIDRNCLEFIKKTEEQENRVVLQVSRDKDDFILNHKKAMDKIEQMKGNCGGVWRKTQTQREKTQN